MHPILAQKSRVFFYLVAWLPVAGLLSALLVYSGELTWMQASVFALPMALLYAFLCLSTWYLCRSLPLQTAGLARLLGTFALASLLSSSLWLGLGRIWSLFLGGWPALAVLGTRYVELAPLILAVGSLLFLLSVAVSYLLATFEAAREAQQRSLELQILAKEAELKALKSQIDPHFLFNSLNSISALTSIDPARSRRMCLLLAAFLRKSLALGARKAITLDEEMSLISAFLEVEQIRLCPRLVIESDVEENARSCALPPLLLQPLIENAILHGISQLLDGGTIRIKAEKLGDRLKIIVENPCDPDSPVTAGKGIGHDNVRNRLRALYGSDGRLELARTANRYRAEVIIPAAPEKVSGFR